MCVCVWSHDIEEHMLVMCSKMILSAKKDAHDYDNSKSFTSKNVHPIDDISTIMLYSMYYHACETIHQADSNKSIHTHMDLGMRLHGAGTEATWGWD